MHVAIIESAKGLAAIQAEVRPCLGGHFVCSLVLVHTSGIDLGCDFGFRLWILLVSALCSMAKYSYRVAKGRLTIFVYGLRLLAFYLWLCGDGDLSFCLYLRINIYLLCYFRRFIRALHASANGIRAARIVFAIVGHRSSSPA